MNQDVLQRLIDNYVEKYDLMNNQEHHEIYKWTAVSNFQKYWDIDAPDFGKMFKKAISESENLVDDNVTQPSRGIDFLCKQDEEMMEHVREAFRELLIHDKSDYKKRQGKIDEFIENINSLLEEAGNEEWKYRQNMKAVIMYLSFIEPDDNFMFREAEVKAFASHVKYTGKIGSGKSFSLKSYYKLCEAVVAALQDAGDLMEMVGAELEREAERTDDNAVTDIDGENHILAFDLIYCAHHYDFYEERVGAARRSTAQPRSDEKELKAAELNEQKEKLTKELDKVRKKREKLELPKLDKKKATHAKYGSGKVVAQEGHYVTVDFDGTEKKFVLPDALVAGHLKITGKAALEKCQEIAELDKQCEKMARELQMTELQLALLEK